MPKPTSGQVHIDKPLTNISVAYMQSSSEFIADKVFPVVPVQKKSDKYFKYSKEDWFRSDAKMRAPGTQSAGGGYELTTDDYVCDRYSIHKDVDDDTRANADAPINVDREATEYVTRQLMLKKEKIWVSDYFTTGIWTGSTTGTDIVPSTLWSAVGSDPVGDVDAQRDAMKQTTSYEPNVMVVSRSVHTILKNHATILERIKYTQKGIVSEDLLATLFGVDKYLVASATENTATEGKDADMNFMFGKDVLLAYAAKSPSIMQPSAGYTFGWNGLLGSGATGSRIKRFRMEDIESDRVEGDLAFDLKVVGADLGVFFNGAIA